ncbi:AraC family transcriptional regulator [Naumannella sp. ID2617S]|nr:AraC family transcriptional regulator [Naumannella sp. ID2617S]
MTESPDLNAPAEGIEIFTVEAMPTLVHRATDHPLDRMTELFDGVFSAEFPELLARVAATPGGPAFSLHHRIPTDSCDLEVGVPLQGRVSDRLTGSNGITLEPSETPAGRVARTSYLGGYAGLGSAWQEFMTNLAAQGHRPAFPFWEVYVTQPTPDADPETMRTDLFTLLG